MSDSRSAFAFTAMLLCITIPVFAQDKSVGGAPAAGPVAAAPATASSSAPAPADSIPIGTTITMQNWNQYKQFMPDGMAALFAGSYAWSMPSSVSMEVGPTVIHPLPKNYLDATEKYSAQVKLIELPDGGLTLKGYQGGTPFPNPADPHKGWKILANLWFRYLPHLVVDTHGNGCLVDKSGTYNCQAATLVFRQLAFNTDPGVPATLPGSGDKFYTQWLMVLEPEQKRYTASLTISYTDPGHAEDSYAFIPALRRYQTVSTLGRCSPNQGTDSNLEDYRFGFDSNITELNVEYVGDRKILTMMDYTMPTGHFPDGFEMPLGWPKPSWGKWQLRDVDVLNVTKISAKAQGYCYGKRVIYVDKATSAPLWEDLYDSNMKPWRYVGLFLRTMDVPQVGQVTTSGAITYAFWDVQTGHATFFIDPAADDPFYINEQAPPEYLDLNRYSEASGLNLIMR